MRVRCPIPSIVALVLVVASPAIGQQAAPSKMASWKVSFEPSALSSQFDVRGKSLMVVGSGKESPELEAAANALEFSYRRTPDVGTVMHAGGLPPLGDLDDRAIIDAAKIRPVQLIVIVRLFPDGSGALNTAVITVYDREGEAQHAFTATAGTRLAASSDTSHAARGVTRKAAETISELHEEQQEEAENARETYDNKFVYIPRDYPGALPKAVFAYQGTVRRGLSGSDFYRAVGREDLADSYATRNGWRWGLTIGGSVVAIVGMVIMLSPTDSCDYSSPTYDACRDDAMQQLTIGTVVMGIGALAFLGMYINPHPVSASEANQLVMTHNSKLRKQLRLPKDYRQEPMSTSQPRIFFAPYAGPSQGGMVLRVNF